MSDDVIIVPAVPRYLMSRRIIVAIQYLLVVVAGNISLVRPTPTVYSAASPWVVYAWATFFLLGGLVSFFGVVSGYRIGEIIGIPLIASACLVYGVAVIYQSTIQTTRSVFVFIFVGVIAISYAVGLFDRFMESSEIIRISEESRERNGNAVEGDDGVVSDQ